MATFWGLSYGHHDAAAVVIRDDVVLFAERAMSRDLDSSILKDLYKLYPPNLIFIHENKKRDMWRKIKTGDWSRLIVPKPWLPFKPMYGNHHLSHAAGAFYTSGFKEALVIVADAIGEQESLAVYTARNGRLNTKPIHTLRYPHSLGLFYSHHAARIGLKPNSEEHIMMRMSLLGEPTDQSVLSSVSIEGNVFHTNYNMHLTPTDTVTDEQQRYNIAATAQKMLEDYIVGLYPTLQNVVFTGGVAYNRFVQDKLRLKCDNLYVPSHPGDAGSAYGAILQHTHSHLPLLNQQMYV